MWTQYDVIDGVEIGCTDALWPVMYRGQHNNFRRPQIALTRATVHKLAQKNLSGDELIQWLYKCVKHSEILDAMGRRREYNSHGRYGHVPYKNKSGYVYFMWCQEKQIMKIGCSGEPTKRKTALQREIGASLEIIATIETATMYELECEIHELYSSRRHDGEWFNITPVQLKIVDRYLKRKGKVAA